MIVDPPSVRKRKSRSDKNYFDGIAMDADVLDLIILFDLVDLLHFTLFPSILVDTYC